MTACIEWWGRVQPNGYGVVRRGQRTIYAHRLVYEECLGPIPEGMQIDHLCKNTRCVNPEHLEVVTPRENVLRSTSPSALRFRQTHCRSGHPLDGPNLYRWGGRRYCRACRALRSKERAAA